jgi:hypothetical protein
MSTWCWRIRIRIRGKNREISYFPEALVDKEEKGLNLMKYLFEIILEGKDSRSPGRGKLPGQEPDTRRQTPTNQGKR